MADGCRLVLIPGLGADERQWEPQRQALGEVFVPPWISPDHRETLPAYAHRLAATIPRERPIILGGSSFGGMLACEMAGPLHAEALILIGSCRSADAIRRDVRWLRPVVSHLPAWGVAAVTPLAPLVLYTFGGLTPRAAEALRGHVPRERPTFHALGNRGHLALAAQCNRRDARLPDPRPPRPDDQSRSSRPPTCCSPTAATSSICRTPNRSTTSSAVPSRPSGGRQHRSPPWPPVPSPWPLTSPRSNSSPPDRDTRR